MVPHTSLVGGFAATVFVKSLGMWAVSGFLSDFGF
jgi:hypothetical protein